MKEYRAQPLEERKSQNLGLWDFMKSKFWATTPLWGALAGYAVGKIGKHKLPIFDGSLPFTSKALEFGMQKGMQRNGVNIGKIEEIDRLPQVRYFYSDEAKQLNAVRNFWNSIKGFEVSLIPTTFFAWKGKEEQELTFVEAYNKLNDLGELRPTHAELELEKRSLQRQLEFVQDKHTGPSTNVSAHNAEITALETVAEELERS